MTYKFLKGYVDGGVFGRNPSPRGIYWSVLVEGHHTPVLIRKQSPDYNTNSDAEWLAFREILQWAVEAKITQPLVVYSDSTFVIKQFNGQHAVHVVRHQEFYKECRSLAAQLKFVSLQLPTRPAKRPPFWPSSRAWPDDWRPRDVLVDKLGH